MISGLAGLRRERVKQAEVTAGVRAPRGAVRRSSDVTTGDRLGSGVSERGRAMGGFVAAEGDMTTAVRAGCGVTERSGARR
jgi:hypothetical protein